MFIFHKKCFFILPLSTSLSHLFLFSQKEKIKERKKESVWQRVKRELKEERKMKRKRKCYGATRSVGNENKHNSCLGQLIKTVFYSLLVKSTCFVFEIDFFTLADLLICLLCSFFSFIYETNFFLLFTLASRRNSTVKHAE